MRDMQDGVLVVDEPGMIKQRIRERTIVAQKY